MKFSDTFKKYFILGVLFIFPIVAYLFLASGVNNFAKLPVVTQGVSDLQNFTSQSGDAISLDNKITILLFLGESPLARKANIYNLAHKIYKKNYLFEDFQFVLVAKEGTQEDVHKILKELKQIENPKGWKFVYGNTAAITALFKSLKTPYILDAHYSSPYAFIIDKDRNLRGRRGDEEVYGYDASDYSLINNKMSDDVKVLLAEYRLALKKYKAHREI
jgi:hypothetical protein